MAFPAIWGLPGQWIAGLMHQNMEMKLFFPTADIAERGGGYCQIPEARNIRGELRAS